MNWRLQRTRIADLHRVEIYGSMMRVPSGTFPLQACECGAHRISLRLVALQFSGCPSPCPLPEQKSRFEITCRTGRGFRSRLRRSAGAQVWPRPQGMADPSSTDTHRTGIERIPAAATSDPGRAHGATDVASATGGVGLDAQHRPAAIHTGAIIAAMTASRQPRTIPSRSGADRDGVVISPAPGSAYR